MENLFVTIKTFYLKNDYVFYKKILVPFVIKADYIMRTITSFDLIYLYDDSYFNSLKNAYKFDGFSIEDIKELLSIIRSIRNLHIHLKLVFDICLNNKLFINDIEEIIVEEKLTMFGVVKVLSLFVSKNDNYKLKSIFNIHDLFTLINNKYLFKELDDESKHYSLIKNQLVEFFYGFENKFIKENMVEKIDSFNKMLMKENEFLFDNKKKLIDIRNEFFHGKLFKINKEEYENVCKIINYFKI